MLPRGAELGDLLEEVRVRVEEERKARAKSSMARPLASAASTYATGVRERERDLLDGRRAGLADVVAGDRDRVPPRHLGAQNAKMSS
jgi:hypothetical protein